MKRFWFISTFLLLLFGTIRGQQGYNQYDGDGNRHGNWRKYFEGTQQLRYEGRFEHGKEVGIFKFYCEDCGDQPMVIKEFKSEDPYANTRFFTARGQLVSEGAMKGKQREGEWLFYHKGGQVVMSREHYREGKLHGKKITYYPSGKKTEELEYQDGKMQGPAFYYGPNGALLKELRYHQDELHGPARYYDAQGEVVISGNYKNGAKHGLWEYFENGSKVLEETYPKKKE